MLRSASVQHCITKLYNKKWYLGEGCILVQPVLHSQHLHVGSKRHLACAVCMEVKLVFPEVLKVLAHMLKVLQSLQV